jgi:hypothetical protein
VLPPTVSTDSEPQGAPDAPQHLVGVGVFGVGLEDHLVGVVGCVIVDTGGAG